MSIKINFVRGDEILTTTMSVGRTMLDAAKKLKIPELFMLERSDHFDENRSRLCCQMDIYDVYEGLTVHLVDNRQDK